MSDVKLSLYIFCVILIAMLMASMEEPQEIRGAGGTP